MKLFIVFLVLVIAGGAYLFLNKTRESLGTAAMSVGNKQIQVEIASTPVQQALGLSGRETLCQNCGMVFTYSRPGFHRFTMKGMNFPLDMIFIHRGVIVEIHEAIAQPKSGELPIIIQNTEQADMVLEVNDGFVWRNKIKKGYKVVLNPNP